MKIILLEDVEKLGQAGDLVDAKSGYARNYLFPRKIAIEATEENLATWQEQKAKEEADEKLRMENAEAAKVKMEENTITLKAKAGDAGRLFGAITAKDIADEIERISGEKIDKRRVQLKENIRTLGEVTVPVKIYNDIVADVKVNVEAL